MKVKIQVLRTKNDSHTLKLNEFYIHSKYDPQKEATTFATKQYEPHFLHVIFGHGLGYVTEALLEEFKFNETLIVVEPLNNSDINECILSVNNKGFKYIGHDSWEDLKFILAEKLAFNTKIKVISLSNYEKVFPKQYKNFLLLIKNEQSRQMYNRNTIKRFSLEWKRNLLLNLPYIKDDFSIDKLKGKYSYPAVIASGGPSLTKQLPFLKKYRSQFILICSGSTINSLLAYNIEPDFVLTIDGSERNYLHFRDIYVESSYIIYSPLSESNIRKSFPKKGYVFTPQEHLQIQKFLKDEISELIDSLYGGASVAHYALAFAKYITSGPIAIIGQDLAFTNNLTHADGNTFQEVSSLEEIIWVDGYYGEPVPSDSAFQSMIQSFEEHNYLTPHTTVYNCTEGGAMLKGYDNMKFESFLELFRGEKVDLEIENGILNISDYNKQIEKVIQEEIKRCESLKVILNSGLNIINSLKDHIPKQSITDILHIEQQFKEKYKKYLFDILIDPISLTCGEKYLPKVNETRREEHIRTLQYINEYYTACLMALENYKKYIEEYV